jgi:hypothetical protein
MNESFPLSILGTGNAKPYGLIELPSENPECDEQNCLGKEFVPREWDVVSLRWDGLRAFAGLTFFQ